MPNRLINETSPYLLQHAHNPVDWYAWGEEALQKANELNKPILVSIGYSACHWCHVMEKESFENPDVAAIMNEHFINIKIDREERPDLDAIYMDAVQAISGSGGWPLNVFLTPEAKPFYGGTYFPPVKAFNRSSWTDTLIGLSTAWKERRHEIESQAENLLAYLNKTNDITQPKNVIQSENEATFTAEQSHTIFKNILASADKEWGGFGKAPKFPQTFTIQYLLEYYHFTKNKAALDQAVLSIDKMLQGGIYDHLAGGLARYSTDPEWLAPHFEKMLYDNALLINILCDVYQITRDEKYSQAIRKTVAFVQEELLSKEGGFYAALDADSEGEEGKYYVWQKAEIEKILDEDAELFCSFFDVSNEGNWEHKNILRILVPADEFAEKNQLDKNKVEKIIEISIKKLKAERKKRIKPSLDDKIILSWNALMLHAVSKAAITLQDEEYKRLAESNFKFISNRFKTNGDAVAMQHTFKNGIAKYPAFLEDYAYFIQACISLYELTFDQQYLNTAKKYLIHTIENFGDEQNLFFYFTNQHQKDIIVRKKEIYDGAMPSGNAVMAKNLLLLSVMNETTEWRLRSEKMLKHLKPMILKYPTSFGNWAILFLYQIIGINEIKITGENDPSITAYINNYFMPNKLVYFDKKLNMPLADDLSKNLTLIYLCKNNVCLAPVQKIEDVIKIIQKADTIE